MESLATSVGTPRGRGVSTASGARIALAMAAAAAVFVGIGVPGAGALGTGGADASSGAAAVVTGTVERLHLDLFGGADVGTDDLLTFVRTGAGAVKVPASDLRGVPDGSRVRLGLADTHGVRVTAAGAVSAEPGTAGAQDPEAGADVASVEVLSQPAAGAVDTGMAYADAQAAAEAAGSPHQVYVVVAVPPGSSAPATSAADVVALVNNQINTYWSTVTGGAVTFTATAHPTTVTTSSVPCGPGANVGGAFTFWNEVATKAGWTEGAGKHLLVYFKRYGDCGGIAGLGSVGSGTASGGVTWSNDYLSSGVIGHELGHNLGLGHSQEADCTVGGVRVMDAPAANCTKRSYWDTNDIMAVSWGNTGFLNASHLRRLGLLGAGAQTAPSGNGQVTLAPLSGGTGQRVLVLSDGATKYVVEYRQATGLDSWMTSNPGWGAPGVTVRREFDQATSSVPFPAYESFVLDGDPATPDSNFGSIKTILPVGVWINLADGHLGLRIVSQAPTGAVIEYRNGLATDDPRYVAPPRPVVSVPRAGLAVGALRTSSRVPVVPVRWRWTVTTPPAAAVSPSSATVRSATATVSVKTGTTSWRAAAYRATARAADGAVVASTGRAQTRYRSDTKGSGVRYSRGWATTKASGALGGKYRATTRRGASVKVTVSGRSAALLLQRGSRNGKVAIYVDGTRVAVLNLRSSSTSMRVAYAVTFAATGTHTLRVTNLSSGARGRLGFDGSVRLV